jgi:hypothetical protein
VHSVRIGTDWATELGRLRAFGRLAREHPDEGRVYIDAPASLRPNGADADAALEWLEEETRQPEAIDNLSLVRSLYA